MTDGEDVSHVCMNERLRQTERICVANEHEEEAREASGFRMTFSQKEQSNRKLYEVLKVYEFVVAILN